MRSVTQKPLRVDANEGWPNKEVALAKLNWLAMMGVAPCEQALPPAMHEETRWLRGKARIPSSPTRPVYSPRTSRASPRPRTA